MNNNHVKIILKYYLDKLFSILIIPSAYFLYFYRRLGSRCLPLTTKRLKNIGVFPIINHYYEPLFDERHLIHPLDRERKLTAINFNIKNQLDLLDKLTFSEELLELSFKPYPEKNSDFGLNNGLFGAGDADFLYQFLRYFQPAKIIEIGSGNSTKVARLALAKNQRDSKHICIEPYEQPWLEQFEQITVVRERIENCSIDWGSELQEGDLLFIDSSHMIRPQGDVLKEYIEIIPSLKSGVFIHIHDIFTPRDYGVGCIVEDVRFWNEQYMLEAILANNNRYTIVASLNLLKNNYYNELKSICPYLKKDDQPGSFYLRVN